jgi:hypothetical protein
MLVQSGELPNHQPHQGKKSDGAPGAVPREIGGARSGVEGSSAEIGLRWPVRSLIEPMMRGNMRKFGVRSPDVSYWNCWHKAVLTPIVGR